MHIIFPRTTRTGNLFAVNFIMFSHASNQVARLGSHVHNLAKTLILVHALSLAQRSYVNDKSAKIYRTMSIFYTA
jgi:hypothetical protein